MKEKDLILELRPSIKDRIDTSKIRIERDNNAIIITLHGFTEPADIHTAYVSCECPKSEGQTQ